MASILDILKNTDFSAALDMLGSKAKGSLNDLQQSAPEGLPGFLGAGAIGAILGKVLGGDATKGVALASLGAVAYNFYKKWAQAQSNQGSNTNLNPFEARSMEQNPPSKSNNQFGPGFDSQKAPILDETAELIARTMNYAARADGNIDENERQRMREVLKNVLPGQNIDAIIDSVSKEPLDPAKIADKVISADQAEDIYRLSCITIDIDHFMEKSYLDALARALGLSSNRKGELETEASSAKKQLQNAISA